MKKITTLIIIIFTFLEVRGEWKDATLRVDFGIYGQGEEMEIRDIRFINIPGWYGKKSRMTEVPLAGNASVKITDAEGDTVYYHTFSTLFNEWYSDERNNGQPAYFENTLLLPMPADSVGIHIRFNDMHHRPIMEKTITYHPVQSETTEADITPKYPVRIIRYGGEDAINVCILAEGYRAYEMNRFFLAAERGVNELMSYAPFSDYPEAFNFYAVGTPSAESGVSKPSSGLSYDSAFGTHFDTFGSEKYLTVTKVHKMHDALAGIPYQHIIVLGNTPEYGGSGIYNHCMVMAADSDRFLPAFVHEFGHSFGGLADEYYKEEIEEGIYPLDVEPGEPNVTTLKEFGSKWEGMLAPGTPIPTPSESAHLYPVGLYEGGGYASKGVYRPANECRMRNNTYSTFCPVCQSALRRAIITGIRH